MPRSADYLERSRKAAERRKKIRMRQIQDAIKFRDKHFPTAISILVFGILLIAFRIFIGLFSSGIESGTISNKGGIIGPFKVESSQLQSIEIEYDLKPVSTKWCSLTLLILDENKNYVGGCNKDLYHEVLWGETYHDEDMNYIVGIDKPGTYYYQFIPKHATTSFYARDIKYNLHKKILGTNFFTLFGIILLILGAIYMVWILSDWELTPYLPDLKSARSKKQIKTVSYILAPILIILILMSVFKAGYADLENAPSSYYSNDDTHYFGK